MTLVAATCPTLRGHRAPATPARSDPSSARCATRSIGKLGSGTGFVDVRSPEEFRGEKLAPGPPARRSSAGARPHRRRREHPVGEGGQRRRHVQDGRRAHASSTQAEGITGDERDHRVLPDRRALERTPGSCSRSCSATPNVKNYDGSWTEYGSLVGAPVEMGTRQPSTEPGLRCRASGSGRGGTTRLTTPPTPARARCRP